MKKLLIITFDLIRIGECNSYAVGSIVSFLKSHQQYGQDFEVECYSYNLLSYENFDIQTCLNSDLFKKDLSLFTHIAISCYCWANEYVNTLIDKLFDCGFQGKIILGGYEISYNNTHELKNLYPKANYFIKGYAESALLEILLQNPAENVLFRNVDFTLLPSPYLTHTLNLYPNISKIRWETKRGCPFKCNFCAHRDLTGKKVHTHELDKVFAELALFKQYNVRKINVLDPVFNTGKTYLEIIKEAKRIALNSELSFQVRPELVTDEFLNSIQNLNVCLEFGIQTMNEQENKAIKRGNNFSKIKETLQKVKERNIKHEVSLIYGLPFQTVTTFSQSIDSLIKMGVYSITAFPLMLLKGTELYDLKNEFNFVEKPLGQFNIPTVIQSNTFTEKEWQKMHEIAQSLIPNNRI